MNLINTNDSGATMKETSNESSVVRVKLDGDLTSTKNITFEADMLSTIKETSPRNIIIDFGGVKMVDSFGIKGIFSINNAIKEIDGNLKLINVSEDIYGLFKYMRMDTHMDIVKKNNE